MNDIELLQLQSYEEAIDNAFAFHSKRLLSKIKAEAMKTEKWYVRAKGVLMICHSKEETKKWIYYCWEIHRVVPSIERVREAA